MHFNQRLLQTFPAAAVILTAAFINCQPAKAILTGPEGLAASEEVYQACIESTPWPYNVGCALLALDPAGGDSISHVNLTMHYDVSKISVDDALSGFLCDFSDGGACPTPDPQLGTVTVPTTTFAAGSPRPDTSYTFSDDKVHGLLSLDYDLSDNPATGIGNRDFFAVSFTPLIPINGQVTFFSTPGNYDFSETSFSCSATQDGLPTQCSGGTPIYGFNLGTSSAAPEPGSLLLVCCGALLIGVAKLRGFVRRRA